MVDMSMHEVKLSKAIKGEYQNEQILELLTS